MNRKLIGGIIIIIGALLLVAIVYFVFLDDFSIADFFNKYTKKEAVQEEIKIEKNDGTKVVENNIDNEIKRITINNTSEEQAENNTSKTEETEDVNQEDLKRMASSFSERFGSYSNHSNFSNIVDLKIFMSKNMKNWADNYIAAQKSKESIDDIYYGITTKAIGEEIKDFNDDINRAEILVKTRRREAIGTTNNMSDIFGQEILITFIKEFGAWKVDSANWLQK